MMPNDECQTCIFWCPLKRSSVFSHLLPECQGDVKFRGECHRFPPLNTEINGSHWPITFNSEHCGEYKTNRTRFDDCDLT